MMIPLRHVLVLPAVVFAAIPAAAKVQDPVPAVAQANLAKGGTVTIATLASPALGEPLQYLVYTPAGYTAGDGPRYPVIYLLHGRGDSMAAWLTVKRDLDRLIESHAIPALIAILPDCPSSHRAGYYRDSEFTGLPDFPAGKKVETALITELVPAIDARFRTKTDRKSRIVAGYSMGGAGALRLALRHPDLFGSAIVLSPAVYVPQPPSHSSTRDFGAYGLGPELFDPATYAREAYPALLPEFEHKALPLFMYIAAGDKELAQENPAESMHNIDVEAHTLYTRMQREPLVTTQFRIVGGHHDWDTWQPTFIEGIQAAFQFFSPTSKR